MYRIEKMMNVVAICLLVSSLATAGFWSPAPEKHKPKQDHMNVIVKDGHRVVVVEYDEDGHSNTKVSISPDEHDEAVATADTGHLHEHEHMFAPKELICDAFGKCKHRIAASLGNAKDKVYEEVDEMKGAAQDAKDAFGKARDCVSRKAHEAVREGTKEAKDAAGGAFWKARERTGEAVKTTKDAAKSGMDMGKTIAGDVSRNVSEAAEKVRHAKDRFTEFGRKYLWLHVSWSYIMILMSLVGFTSAYGMCMWVTFLSSYVLAGALPRHQFGMVQSKIYPVYFRAMATSIGVALLGHSLSDADRLLSIFSANNPLPHMFQPQAYNLLGSLLMVLANMLYLEPRATKVMFERMKLEKEEGRGREHEHDVSGEASRSRTMEMDGEVVEKEKSGQEVMRARLNQRLRNLNTCSSLLNILTLMSLTWHLVYLTQRLASTR